MSVFSHTYSHAFFVHSSFFSVIMDQAHNAGGDQGGNSCPSYNLNKRKALDKADLKERRKRLRLPVDNPAAQAPTASAEDEDPDFEPNVVASNDEAEAGDDISEAGDDSRDGVGGGRRGKTKAKAIRCSPRNFLKLANALSDDVKREVIAKGFRGLLNFKPHLLRNCLAGCCGHSI
jgi:hypothetical protein